MQQNEKSSSNPKISLEQLPPKMLLCECLDLATQLFTQLIKHYVASNKLQNPTSIKYDLSSILNYILEPVRLENILAQFIKIQDKNAKIMVKSYLFELRNIRNCWAHNSLINYRMCNRCFDTLELLFDAFGGDKSSRLYQKIQFYRRSLILMTAKNYQNQMKSK